MNSLSQAYPLSYNRICRAIEPDAAADDMRLNRGCGRALIRHFSRKSRSSILQYKPIVYSVTASWTEVIDTAPTHLMV